MDITILWQLKERHDEENMAQRAQGDDGTVAGDDEHNQTGTDTRTLENGDN